MTTHSGRSVRFNHSRTVLAATTIAYITAAGAWSGCLEIPNGGRSGESDGTLDRCTSVVGECDPSPSPSHLDAGVEFADDHEGSPSTALDNSTLCYEITRTGDAEYLEAQCTPDADSSCSEFGLNPSSFVYSSWTACIDDTYAVVTYWERTGELGGASPDADANTSSGTETSGGSETEICFAEQRFPDGTGTTHTCTDAACSAFAGSTQDWAPGACPTRDLTRCCVMPSGINTYMYSDCSTTNCTRERFDAECERQNGTPKSGDCR